MITIYRDNENAFTLIELLIVLLITAAMMTLGIMGMIKLRQVLQVTNASKELALNLKQARRFALDNVVTSSGTTPTEYYIEFSGNDYFWGECDANGCQTGTESMKASQYGSVEFSLCDSGAYPVIHFHAVNGEIVITDLAGTSAIDTCDIGIGMSTGIINTMRTIDINTQSRTIQMLL